MAHTPMHTLPGNAALISPSNYWGKNIGRFMESMISANIFSLIITRDSRSTVVVSGGCGEASLGPLLLAESDDSVAGRSP